MLLGVDVGGTFTDAVLARDGELFTSKTPTTPADESQGVMAAVEAVLRDAGAAASDVERFAHGMTVGTNALLEGRGARTALMATAGFTDVVELGRQARAHLYRLCERGPAPLAAPELRIGVEERTTPDGPLRQLDGEAIEAACAALAASGAQAAAVVLLHSYRHPGHERALGEAIARALPGVHVSLSHEVTATFREYERSCTTEVDAALSPLLGRYLRDLGARAVAAGLPEPQIMQSSGGLTDLERAAGHAAMTVLSGPAGGAAGGAFVAATAGAADALGFDMGGTSCDVCVIEDGRVRETAGRVVGGRALALPMLDVHTVGAGGGSLAWRDAGGALRVGPRSAGAEPGPACYGRGGEAPTVTDANLLLGYLGDGAVLAGGVRLDRDAARRAIEPLASALSLTAEDCAAGIVRVANAEMARALRVMTVERGVDPRGFALLPFGGAGPMHAAAIADELELRCIVCPRASGVLAALGLVVSERRRDAERSVLLSGSALTADAIGATVADLAQRVRGELDDEDAPLRVTYELRYRGQAFELAVRRDGPADPDDLREAFADAHEQRYGYRDDEAAVELVTIRAAAFTPGADVVLAPTGSPRKAAGPHGRREAVFAGRRVDATVWSGDPEPGAPIRGPAICELPEATLVVPPGWRGEVGADATIVLGREPGSH